MNTCIHEKLEFKYANTAGGKVYTCQDCKLMLVEKEPGKFYRWNNDFRLEFVPR